MVVGSISDAGIETSDGTTTPKGGAQAAPPSEATTTTPSEPPGSSTSEAPGTTTTTFDRLPGGERAVVVAITDGDTVDVDILGTGIDTVRLIGFDPDFEEASRQFCLERDIDSLPALDGSSVWVSTAADSDFRPIPDERRVDASTHCFDPALPGIFREHDVLFVQSSTGLVGAVHASDYNRSAVSSHLYDLISCYERALRTLAIQLELSEDSLIALLEKEEDGLRRVKRLRSGRRKDPNLPQFQVAYVDDLQKLINVHTNLNVDLESVCLARNSTMHSKEFVNQVNRDDPDLVYDPASFQRFFEAVQNLQYDLRRVINQTRFVGGLQGVGQPP